MNSIPSKFTAQLLIYSRHLLTATTLPWGNLFSGLNRNLGGSTTQYFTLRKIGFLPATVCQHRVHIRRSTFCSLELRRSLFQTYGFWIVHLNPDDNRLWGIMQDHVYRCQFVTSPNWGSAWLTHLWMEALMNVLMNGIRVFKPVWTRA